MWRRKKRGIKSPRAQVNIQSRRTSAQRKNKSTNSSISDANSKNSDINSSNFTNSSIISSSEDDEVSRVSHKIKPLQMKAYDPLLSPNIIERLHKLYKRNCQNMKQNFSKYDRDHSGVLHKDIFSKCLSKSCFKSLSTAELSLVCDCFCIAQDKNIVNYVCFLSFVMLPTPKPGFLNVLNRIRRAIESQDSSYDLYKKLQLLDENNNGWLPSHRVLKYLKKKLHGYIELDSQEQEGIIQHFEIMSPSENQTEDRGVINIQNFALWVQPKVHIQIFNVKERFILSILLMQSKRGWNFSTDVLKMLSKSNNTVDREGFLVFILSIGLPLIEPELFCLLEDFDLKKNGNISRKKLCIFLREMEKNNNSSSEDVSSDQQSVIIASKRKKKARDKNINTFSWRGNKSFEQKAKNTTTKVTASSVVLSSTTASELVHSTNTEHQRKKRKDVLARRIYISASSDSLGEKTVVRKTEINRNLKNQSSHRASPTSSSQSEELSGGKINKLEPHTSHSKFSGLPANMPALNVSNGISKQRASRTQRVGKRHSKSGITKKRLTYQDSHIRGHRRGLHLEQQRLEIEVSKTSNDPVFHNHNVQNSGLSGVNVHQLRHFSDWKKKKSNKNGPTKIINYHKDNASDIEYYEHVVESLHKTFEFFDLNKNKYIEVDEMKLVFRTLGLKISHSDLEEALSTTNLENNGKLDLSEFVQFVKWCLRKSLYLMTKERELEIRHAFQTTDTHQSRDLNYEEFHYLIYKLLGVELTVEEMYELLKIIDSKGDGHIKEHEFIQFMQSARGKSVSLVSRHTRDTRRWLEQKYSVPAISALKKILRGRLVDIETSLLMFFAVPTTFRYAITSKPRQSRLRQHSMDAILSYPSPQTALLLGADSPLLRLCDQKVLGDESFRLVQDVENRQHQAFVSLKKCYGVPKPFDTRDSCVVKRVVHVCLFEELAEIGGKVTSKKRKDERDHNSFNMSGDILGNIVEIPVTWTKEEEDVWDFGNSSKKDYKFLVRTDTLHDHMYLLIEFIAHLKLSCEDLPFANKLSTASKSKFNNKHSYEHIHQPKCSTQPKVSEMVCCWCKIPLQHILAKRKDAKRESVNLLGGTVYTPMEINQNEVLQRRSGWRALRKTFQKMTPPVAILKYLPVDKSPANVQSQVKELPPKIIAPYIALSVLVEYMLVVKHLHMASSQASGGIICDPVMSLFPKVIDDYKALSIFQDFFQSEISGITAREERSEKFRQLVIRVWPAYCPYVCLDNMLNSKLLSIRQMPDGGRMQNIEISQQVINSTSASKSGPMDISSMSKYEILQHSLSGKIKMQDITRNQAPFHVREVSMAYKI